MKLVIDIPEEMIEAAKTDMWCGSPTLGYAIKKGTPLMTSEKLDKITTAVADVFRSYGFGNCIVCKDPECDECNKKHTIYDALDVLASVHNELYKEVTGKYYDYMFHWANHGYEGDPDDGLFKEKEGDDK